MGEKFDLQGVASIVECEGLGYAVMHYIDGSRIEDEELARLWDEARALLKKIESKLPELEEEEAE